MNFIGQIGLRRSLHKCKCLGLLKIINRTKHDYTRFDLHATGVRTNFEVCESKPEGIDFLVRYVDTMATKSFAERIKTPTVLVLHGLAQTYIDCLPLMEELADNGCRVVAPSLPGSRMTQGWSKVDEEYFQYSMPEYAQFVANFLSIVGVDVIHLAIGVSSGANLALPLLTMSDVVKSVLLINPFPGVHDCELVKRAKSNFAKGILKLADFSITSSTANGQATKFFKDNGLSLCHSDSIPALKCLSGLVPEITTASLIALESSKRHATYVFCDKDAAISPDLHLENLELLGITSNEVAVLGQKTAVIASEEIRHKAYSIPDSCSNPISDPTWNKFLVHECFDILKRTGQVDKQQYQSA